MLAAAAPATAAADRESARAAATNLVTSLQSNARSLADDLTAQYIAWLGNVGGMLDEKGITSPPDRAALLEKMRDSMALELLAQYDTFAAATEASLSPKLSIFIPPVSSMLQSERAPLAEFLEIDPAIVLWAARYPRGEEPPATRMIVARARAKAADAYAALSFADKLRLATPKGDAAIRKVVSNEVGGLASNLGAGIFAQYESYLIRINRMLDEEGVADTAVRKMILGPRARDISDSMLAQFDRFAAKTLASFKGTTPVIETAAKETLAEERAALVEKLEISPGAYRWPNARRDATTGATVPVASGGSAR